MKHIFTILFSAVLLATSCNNTPSTGVEYDGLINQLNYTIDNTVKGIQSDEIQIDGFTIDVLAGGNSDIFHENMIQVFYPDSINVAYVDAVIATSLKSNPKVVSIKFTEWGCATINLVI